MNTPHPMVPSEFDLVGVSRQSRFGSWAEVDGRNGKRFGVLRISHAAIAEPARREALLERIARVSRLMLPGVLPIVDVMADTHVVRVFTAAPASPLLAEVASSTLSDPLSIAVQVGQTLMSLHQAGVVNGGLDEWDVVITDRGPALIHVGLAEPPATVAAGVPADVRGWCRLVRVLADRTAGPVAAQLHHAAAGAEVSGLRAGLERLRQGAPVTEHHHRPTVVRTSAGPGDGTRPRRSPWPEPRSVAESTRFGHVGPPQIQTPPSPGYRVVGPPPAIPYEAPPPVPRWIDVPSVRRRRRWITSLIGALCSALVLAGVLFFLHLQLADPLEVTGATVAAVIPPDVACDITVDVVGAIQTNGQPGTISYQWLRSDGQTSAVLTQSVSGEPQQVDVHLYWTLSGKGSRALDATLRVIQPNPTEATTQFTYSCQ